MKKKGMHLFLTVMMITGVLAGCGSESKQATEANKAETEKVTEAQTAGAETEAAESQTEAAESQKGTAENLESMDAANYMPVENKENKEIKIATLLVQNNPFWVTVSEGAETAKALLKDYNCTVDIISFNDFDGQAFAEAINTCVVKGYDAICTVGVADSIVPAVDAAVKAGIPVYTFNSETEKESQRIAFVGQDLYAAGVKEGETLAELMGGEGKVGIITGLYSVNAHELRRTGIEEGLGKSADIEIVGTVENNDSGDEAYTATKDFLTANPDLKGIAVTAGGPHGAAKAIEELGKQDQIQLVCFDTTDEIVAYLKKGVIKATIGQDPFGQGADPLVLAYNHVITGEPEVTGKAYTKMETYTPENISQFFPD